MLANRFQTVSLSFISTDLPIWQTIVTQGSMFQKDEARFHLLLDRQNLPQSVVSTANQPKSLQGRFWLDISPYRVIMTMQSDGNLSYRHFWERGIYGSSQYCLNTDLTQPGKSLRFQNFTTYLQVDSSPSPRNVRINYELWATKVLLGSYMMHLAID